MACQECSSGSRGVVWGRRWAGQAQDPVASATAGAVWGRRWRESGAGRARRTEQWGEGGGEPIERRSLKDPHQEATCSASSRTARSGASRGPLVGAGSPVLPSIGWGRFVEGAPRTAVPAAWTDTAWGEFVEGGPVVSDPLGRPTSEWGEFVEGTPGGTTLWELEGSALPEAGPTTLPRHSHYVHPPGDWASRACAAGLDGDEETCRTYVHPRRLDDVWLHAFAADVADSFTIEGETDAERGLIVAAWALLHDASDLVRWAMCWFNGDPDAGRCMRAYLAGEGEERVKIIVEPGTDPDGEGVVMSTAPDSTSFWEWLGLDRGTRRIYVWRGNEQVAGLTAMWDLATSPAEQYCAAFLFAYNLLHELAHVCGREEHDEPGECADPYVIQNIFIHAAFHLHRDITESACCEQAWELIGELSTGETMTRPVYFATEYKPYVYSRACHTPSYV